MTALWIPTRKRRFEMAIRHLPIEERGRLWVLYHEKWSDNALELRRVCEELKKRAEWLYSGVR